MARPRPTKPGVAGEMMARRNYDTVILGGGTAGAVVAGLLADGSSESILLLEAGADYGAFEAGRWPSDLLDARALAYTHDWKLDSEATYPGRVVPFERACVMGGCSSHNGCAAIWGSRVDYDDWANRGLAGWSTDDLLPFFQTANERMRVRNYEPSDITPFHQACLEAAEQAGISRVSNLNDLDEDEGIAPSPVNIWHGNRWNSALAFLDPARTRPNLEIEGNALVDRLLIEKGRATGVRYIGADGPTEVRASRFVIAGGTYGSPAILMRSGVGDPVALSTLGIEATLELRGVGQNLHDHSAVQLEFSGSETLVKRMRDFGSNHWMPEEQTIAKLRSPHYPIDEAGFDLHVYPVGGPDDTRSSGWHWQFPVACMTPRSRGWLKLRSSDPNALPLIDHRYISDEHGHDRAVLVAGVHLVREWASQGAFRDLLGDELAPGPDAKTASEIAAWIDASVGHYYHPVGTCAMGEDSDAMAVTDARGKVHGLDNTFVADCSIVPVIPRANTNIPAVVIGQRIARWLLAPEA